ncbi:ADP-ribosylglycohydrolase family protein [Acanthopleuribacter pedis]|uniref:ADP-ribosylglycohydrolase family protein n=1 Tax=Acanthopleuribacter pedis TaxID=442870 RepID=UPI001FAE9209
MRDIKQRKADTLACLNGLSVGDAFGQLFFRTPFSRNGEPPAGPWRWTDDTAMGLSVVENLFAFNTIDCDDLARRFARRYGAEPSRGYGGGAHDILGGIAAGRPWRDEASEAFGGEGSMGNGGAMRAAPIGIFLAHDLDGAAAAARRASMVTHFHPEGQVGAVAVALAAAFAFRARGQGKPNPGAFLEAVTTRLPQSEVRRGLEKARGLSADSSVETLVTALGNGSRVMAQDTVPAALWVSSHFLDDYEEALWRTVALGGDMDTNAAIVGGVVAAYTGIAGIPNIWLTRREPLPPLDETNL